MTSNWRRYGAWRVVRAYCLRKLRRILSVSQVAYATPDLDYAQVADYENRIVDRAEFESHFQVKESDLTSRRTGFARGDRCVATFNKGVIVGCNFYTEHPTVVDDHTEILLPG